MSLTQLRTSEPRAIGDRAGLLGRTATCIFECNVCALRGVPYPGMLRR